MPKSPHRLCVLANLLTMFIYEPKVQAKSCRFCSKEKA